MSPYLVTTRRCHLLDPTLAQVQEHPPLYRRAVATLEEAQRAVIALAAEQDYRPYTAAAISESGGTVGPLPDGTAIEVEQTTDQRLTDDLPDHMRNNLWRRHPSVMPRQALCDAWNARQS